MPQSNISLWLRFALQQVAAESYLDDIESRAPQMSPIAGNNPPE